MNLPPDKMKLLNQYDNEKKWELICDQERFQVKNPPSAYIQKLKSYLDTGGVSRKVRAPSTPSLLVPQFKRRVQESTQVLRELEISLRTNYIGWVQEFLNEENKGLDVLLEYLAFAQCSVTYDMESAENGSPGSDQGKVLERSLEDLNKSTSSSPTQGTSKSGFSLVMNHPACVNEITLSLNNKNARTKALVLELLAAVCLVRGGHDIILAAFDNFKEVCGEKNRFEKLMEYFRNEDTNIDFMVACMQFINIVVHSVENMNFRVFLQYEFTHLGLDHYLETLRLTESDKLQVQIQAYLDNVFDVGAMLEDSETKTAVLEHMEELQEHVNQLTEKLQDAENDSMAKIAELEKQLSQARRELEALRVSTLKVKKPIQTKFRMPVFNWVALKPSQIDGTVFTELNDEKVLQELDMSDFEEQFKTKAQGPGLDISALKVKATQKAPSKVTLMESNRAKNLAITLRKGGRSIQDICTAIETYDQQALSLDFLELLLRFLPTEYERTLIGKFEREQQPPEELSDEDQFMIRFSKIPRLAERMNVMIFLGNFNDTAQLLMPQLNAIIAASMSLKSSTKLRNILEPLCLVLAFGNYMNSSKRGAAYGFRLQSLDALLEMKSTDRKQTLLHYLVRVITEKYPELTGFHTELHFLDKAGTVSLDSVLQDVRSLQQGMELTRKEFMRQDDSPVLKDFLKIISEVMEKLQADSKTAKVGAGGSVGSWGRIGPPHSYLGTPRGALCSDLCPMGEASRWDVAPAGEPGGIRRGMLPIQKAKRQQMDMIAELKKKQMVKEPLIYEGKDGAIEDIISDLRNNPYRRADKSRGSAKKRAAGQSLQATPDISL
ncbi:PREDICTED: formin-like protein 1 [Charadrius vociferus]|nr:PREDICTED: formin-like protein 1 [Charadrius vociferus]